MKPRSIPVGSTRTANTSRRCQNSWSACWIPRPAIYSCRNCASFKLRSQTPGCGTPSRSLLLKIASPGVPDFYQGNDLWAFDLVDPDNRRAVNYDLRRQMLRNLREQAARDQAALVDRLRENPCDGGIKAVCHQRGVAIPARPPRSIRTRLLHRTRRGRQPRPAHRGLLPLHGESNVDRCHRPLFLQIVQFARQADRRRVGQHGHRASQEDRAPELSRYFHRRNPDRGRSRWRPISPAEQGLRALSHGPPVCGERGLMHYGATALPGGGVHFRVWAPEAMFAGASTLGTRTATDDSCWRGF